jgi:hypothetical protein
VTTVSPGSSLIPAGGVAPGAANRIPVRFEPHDVLLRQGDTSHHVHVVLAGCVKVMRSESDGSRMILTRRAAGDVVADLAAVDLQPRLATVTALTTTVTRLLTGSQLTCQRTPMWANTGKRRNQPAKPDSVTTMRRSPAVASATSTRTASPAGGPVRRVSRTGSPRVGR